MRTTPWPWWPGSSPHTRGLPPRITTIRPPAMDHPRTRGVYHPMGGVVSDTHGSSPHTRGLPAGSPALRRRRGIIPAHAGFTVEFLAQEEVQSDHPRTRGVYSHQRQTIKSPSGSSPHTRGLHLVHVPDVSGIGIIPAHAGFTPHLTPWIARGMDHPRTRGVYSRGWYHWRYTYGSSPHTRGLPMVSRAWAWG